MDRHGIPVSRWVMTEEEQKIAIENFHWIPKYAYKLYMGKYGLVMSFDDILSHCAEGLCKGAMTFDESKGYPLLKHIKNHMRWEIQRALKYGNTSVKATPSEKLEPFCVDYKVEANEILERAGHCLTDIEKTIFRMKFLEGYSYVEIGKFLAVSKQRVQKRAGDIIKKLKGNDNVHCCVR